MVGIVDIERCPDGASREAEFVGGEIWRVSGERVNEVDERG